MLSNIPSVCKKMWSRMEITGERDMQANVWHMRKSLRRETIVIR